MTEETMGFVIEDGPVVVQFSLGWKERMEITDEEKRCALLTVLDALHEEVMRPWVEAARALKAA